VLFSRLSVELSSGAFPTVLSAGFGDE